MSRLSLRLTQAYVTAVTSTRAIRPSQRMRSQRGATFIEYVILAAIAVAIGLIIQNFLAGNNGWIHKMLNVLNSSPNGTTGATG